MTSTSDYPYTGSRIDDVHSCTCITFICVGRGGAWGDRLSIANDFPCVLVSNVPVVFLLTSFGFMGFSGVSSMGWHTKER